MSLRSTALKFIVLLGIVSLFADMTYEGARSITGPFLALLGASGTIVGVVIGLGELIGYGFRGISGYLSDKTHRYWTITFVGYTINLLAVPLLAFAKSWEMAAFLIILERFGKSIRVPARDAMLSYAAKHTGRGWGFGIHEALDQIGAVCGPLIIAILLLFNESYRVGFAFLAIPAVIALLMLNFARISNRHPHHLEPQTPNLKAKGLGKTYWVYIIAVGLVALGYVDFALIAFHFQKASTITPLWIPFLYAIAMAVDGLAALAMGKWFDIRGISVLAILTGITAAFAPLVFFGNLTASIIGMILWGIGLGAQETIMRAIVAHLVPPDRRGSAYGVMNMVFGISWAAGSAVKGFFYDVSLLYLVIFSVIAQLAAIPFFLTIKLKRAT